MAKNRLEGRRERMKKIEMTELTHIIILSVRNRRKGPKFPKTLARRHAPKITVIYN